VTVAAMGRSYGWNRRREAVAAMGRSYGDIAHRWGRGRSYFSGFSPAGRKGPLRVGP
jgi:hypothetical protein